MALEGLQGTQISIHALREEGDLQRKSARDEKDEFLSTPSARRATLTSPPGAFSV